MTRCHHLFLTLLISAASLLALTQPAVAGTPLWTFEALTSTTLTVPANSTANVQYRITNQSQRTHTLMMRPIAAVTQITSGTGICPATFTLTGHASCVLSLQINGSAMNNPISDGPIVCDQHSALQCYRPSAANVLRITRGSANTMADISLSTSSLILTVNGSADSLLVHNDSTSVTATNIAPELTGTALDGNVNVTGNTCAALAPGADCAITFTPGSTIVAATDFPVQGTNTNSVTGNIQIVSGTTLSGINPSSGTASGGTGVTLTGTGLTGATGITFDGVAATSVNVVNSTTVTAVTPAHAAGVVDVVISTPAGGSTLSNGYTYVSTAVGQAASGGVIACINGGLQNLVSAVSDNSNLIQWGGSGTTTNAQSDTDGAIDTATILPILGSNGGTPYAAKLCNDFEVDSQGNTPCQAGNTCYADWFLPAKDQLNCLFTNRSSIGGFSTDTYLSSTESSTTSAFSAWGESFLNGSQAIVAKGFSFSVRCVRAFTP